jgi:hypothetical protein
MALIDSDERCVTCLQLADRSVDGFHTFEVKVGGETWLVMMLKFRRSLDRPYISDARTESLSYRDGGNRRA